MVEAKSFSESVCSLYFWPVLDVDVQSKNKGKSNIKIVIIEKATKRKSAIAINGRDSMKSLKSSTPKCRLKSSAELRIN